MKDNINNILEFVQSILDLTGHQESSQTKMKDAEVITTAIVAGIYFNGNFQKALTFLKIIPILIMFFLKVDSLGDLQI